MTVSAAPFIFYPESDGQPLADNTIQFHLIITIQGGTDVLFANDPNVFVAGDLFWYPVEGEPGIKQADDVMVAFGRPKGHRRSYKQWEEDNIPPQVVFEIASPSNTRKELEETKLRFYQLYGVEEYYIFDPDKGVLKGWLRQGANLKPISEMLGWISPRLHVRFQVTDGNLELYGPDGEKFASYLEIAAQNKLSKERAERESQRAERVEREKNALANKQRKSVTRLLAMGLTVEQVAEALELSLEQVRDMAL